MNVRRWALATSYFLVSLAFIHAAVAAKVPLSNVYLSWGPHEYMSGVDDAAHQAAWDEISQITNYTDVIVNETSDPTGGEFNCTVLNLKDELQEGRGIILVVSHSAGNQDVVVDQFGTDHQAMLDRLVQYSAVSELTGHLDSGGWTSGGETHWGIFVSSELTEDWANDYFWARHGISFIVACQAADLGYNSFWSETSFGYEDPVTCPQGGADAEGIFSRMNGSVANGNARTAAAAHAHYNDPSPPVIQIYPKPLDGAGVTELCPVVTDVCPGDGDETSGLEGGGHVNFSSQMDDSVAATSIVSISGGTWQTGGAPTWINTTTIGFDWEVSSPGWVTITVSGGAKAITIDGNLIVDGNDGTPGNPNGIAPNGDDHVERFYADNP